MITDNNGYYNFWRNTKSVAPKFTELEIALMEGGHSLEKEPKLPFIQSLLKESTLPSVLNPPC